MARKNNQVRKVVIPVAGLGTRLLPATKAQPKEMLPVVDKPTIQYIVEEAVRAGITDVILVTGSVKRAIEDHFDRNEFLENHCLKNKKMEACRLIQEIAEVANFIYIRQKGPYGSATPVLNAKSLIGDEPFAVLYGDDIWDCPRKPHLKQLMEVYEKYGDPVITAYPTDDEGTSKYGIIDGVEVEPGIYQVKSILEKPGPQKAKTRIATLGGYILTPDIFEEIEKMKVKKNRELYLTEAIAGLMKKRPIYARVIDGVYYDTGSKLGLLKTNIDFALKDKSLKKEIIAFMKKKIKTR